MSAHAQQKKLAKETTFKLTDSQIIAISAKIDSLKTLLMSTSSAPANELTKFLNRVDNSLIPFWKPVIDQMVVDSVKKAGK